MSYRNPAGSERMPINPMRLPAALLPTETQEIQPAPTRVSNSWLRQRDRQMKSRRLALAKEGRRL